MSLQRPAPPGPAGAPRSGRGPLRLAMSGRRPGRDTLDGGWWPRSRDLDAELADLVDHFPVELGRVVRALSSPADWDARDPGRVRVRRGSIEAGSLPRDDTHLVLLTTSDGEVYRVLVIPPTFTQPQGAEALLAAATPRNAHAAAELLDLVTDQPDADPADVW